jgi:hypothetical protein
MDISSDSKTSTTTTAATAGTKQPHNQYLLVDWREVTNPKTKEVSTKMTVAVLPSMVKINVTMTEDETIPVKSAEIQARCLAGNFYRVALEGFDIDKAWNGFGDKGDGYTFKAKRGVLLT